MHVIAPTPETVDLDTIQSYVQLAFHGILGREAEPEGLNHFVAKIQNQELTAHRFLMELLDCGEFINQPLPENFGESMDELLRSQLEANDAELTSDPGPYVQLAFQTLLRREPLADELAHYRSLLTNQTVLPSQFLHELMQSVEVENNRLARISLEVLHRSRIQVVKQLPKAQVILDLGGASGDSEGALLQMGYPYPFQHLSIIDMPLELRHEVYGDLGYYPDVIHSKQGPIQWYYRYMTDLADFPSGTFDLVFSGESIEHVTRAEATVVCREAYRLLKPGGYFCLDTPNRTVTAITHGGELVHPEHKHEYTHAELSSLLHETGFVIQEAKGICWASAAASTGGFPPGHEGIECLREVVNHEGVYDDIENCFCLYYRCQKPA